MFLNRYFTNNNNLTNKQRVIKYNYGSNCYEYIKNNDIVSKNKKIIPNFLDIISILGININLKAIELAKKNILNKISVSLKESNIYEIHQFKLFCYKTIES